MLFSVQDITFAQTARNTAELVGKQRSFFPVNHLIYGQDLMIAYFHQISANGLVVLNALVTGLFLYNTT